MTAVRLSRRLTLVLAFLILAATAPGALWAIAGAPSAEIPNNPVGEQLAWVLETINDDGASGREVADRFSDAFLGALPSDQLIAILDDLAQTIGPVRVARFEGPVTDTDAVAVITTGTADDWRITIKVEARPPHRIDDLFLTPVTLPAPPPSVPRTWQALDRQMRSLAPRVSFLAAELVDGECRPVHALEPDRTLATASTFKLYVLGELARQIEQGTAAWDEPLAIRDDWKSLPSGDMRLEPAGTTFPLRYYAEQMISESDNTATDHLIHRLGRENVEAFIAATGHADPASNVPLLTTREWFALKVAVDPSVFAAYVRADAAERRAILENDVAHVTVTEADTVEDWSTPKRTQTIEWFASATDLCRALATLQAMAERPGLAPLYDVLSINPGVTFDARTWSYVGHKAGYETGVWNKTWLLRRSDDRWFVLTVGLNDPVEEPDLAAALQLMVPAANLLAG